MSSNLHGKHQIRVGIRDLRVGGCYQHANGTFIRQIDAIEGDTIVWHDATRKGRCSKRVFLSRCPCLAPDTPEANPKPKTTAATLDNYVTLRDEANALTVLAFSDSLSEALQTGESSRPPKPPGSRRIDGQMRRLLIQASSALERLLRLKQDDGDKYELLVRGTKNAHCRNWKG